MSRLTKRDVEQLLAGFDDDPVAALRQALGRVLDRPDDDWATLLELSGLPSGRVRALRRGDQAALDDLARTLNEQRDLPRPDP
jgi:hypothetical protein